MINGSKYGKVKYDNIEINVFNKHINEYLTEYVKKIGGYSDIHSTPSSVVGKGFLTYFLREMFCQVIDISDEEIELGIVDKSGDLGIDFIHIIDNDVYLVQAMYTKSSRKDNYKLKTFLDIPNVIKQKNFTSSAHRELQDILESLSLVKNPIYHLIYVTNATIDSEKIKKYENLYTKENVEIDIWSLRELHSHYISLMTEGFNPPKEVEFAINGGYFSATDDLKGKFQTIILIQDGLKLAKLYDQYGDDLYHYNIKFWLGNRNIVNKGMQETIDEEPEKFFYYNNGCTAICTGIEDDKQSGTIICSNFQVINGAQTITTISKSNRENLSRVKVLMRLIICNDSLNSPTIYPEIYNIVKNINTQNITKNSDFRSNDLVQISIEKQISHMKFCVTSPFKDCVYKRKRNYSVNANQSTKVITMRDLGEAYYSFTSNPYTLNANINKLWDATNDGIYNVVFGYNDRQIDIMPLGQVNKLFSIFCIYEYVKNRLKEVNKDQNPAILFKYHILWAIRLLLQKKYSDSQIDNILLEIARSGTYINERVNSDKEKAFNFYLEKATAIVGYAIQLAKESSNKGYVLRNYQRDKNFANQIERFITNMVITKELPDLVLNYNK